MSDELLSDAAGEACGALRSNYLLRSLKQKIILSANAGVFKKKCPQYIKDAALILEEFLG